MASILQTRKRTKKHDGLKPSRQNRLLEIVGKAGLGAGSNTVLDIVAARVVERSHIPLVVLDGRNPENLSRAILTGEFTGTVVSEKKRKILPL